MAETKKAVVLNTVGVPYEVTEFKGKERGLDFYYDLLECRCIDFPYAKRLPNKYCLVVDDEGLFKEEPIVNPIASALYGMDEHGQPIVGKAMIAKNNPTEDGLETVGLTDEEAQEVLSICGFAVMEMLSKQS